jgi:DNA-binding NarL/FixJ family response regulator
VRVQYSDDDFIHSQRAANIDRARELAETWKQGAVGKGFRRCDYVSDATLTRREAEVLRRYALGQADKTIAAKLGISASTVEAHKANAMRKLGLVDRESVVAFAVEQGWFRNAESNDARKRLNLTDAKRRRDDRRDARRRDR